MTTDGLTTLVLRVNITLTILSTVFLGSRLWCRAYVHRGLWWDDYALVASWLLFLAAQGLQIASLEKGFNVSSGTGLGFLLHVLNGSFVVFAIAWSKSAFAITLHRLSRGWHRVGLWVMVLSINLMSAALVLSSWFKLCDAPYDYPRISPGGACQTFKTNVAIASAWTALSMLLDFALSIYPWMIIRRLVIPAEERKGVAIAMGVVGLAGFVAVGKLVVASRMNTDLHTVRDTTYDIQTFVLLSNIETCMTIVAQAMPILRVLVQHWSEPASTRSSTTATSTNSVVAPPRSRPARPSRQPGSSDDDDDDDDDFPTDMVLVQLPSGRIVPAAEAEAEAEADRGRAAGYPSGARPIDARTVPVPPTAAAEDGVRRRGPGRGRGRGANAIDGNDHQIWSSLGLSRKVGRPT